jgi:hypothetical protein
VRTRPVWSFPIAHAVATAATLVRLSPLGMTDHAFARSVRDDPRCAIEELTEAAWKRRGPWRRMSPYPESRDVAPTDSIGVWLERWGLADGDLDLRRVSDAQTTVLSIRRAQCSVSVGIYERHFALSAPNAEFRDVDLLRLLGSTVSKRGSGWTQIRGPRP